MRRSQFARRLDHPVIRCGFVIALISVAGVAGCGHEEKTEYTSVAKPPTVRVTHPQERKIVRVVGQPSFIEAYERTSIYPKFTAYIDDWIVDIGDRVKKGELLARLFAPELVEDYETKNATVKLDEERVELKKKQVEVADANVKAAAARLVEAKAILAKYQSEVDRWSTEVKRLNNEVKRGVVDPQILLESTNQWKSAIAAKDAAEATIEKADAELLSAKAALAEAKVDVAVAENELAVATSEWKRIGAWVGYLDLAAPFDGIVYARNANTMDFVLPSTGDPTADPHSPQLSPSGAAAPIYVIDRTDIVRVYVDIPEADANYVNGVDLRLMSVKRLSDLPSAGRALVILANVQDMLYFRIFDPDGRMVVDTDEDRLRDQSEKIKETKQLVRELMLAQRSVSRGKNGIVPAWAEKVTGEKAPRISPLDKDRLLAIITSIFGRTSVPSGTRASVLVKGYRDEPISGAVTRTSWALNVKSRTLRAEIDLKNPRSQLLPGMYAYAKVIIERNSVRALPLSALTYSGDLTFCWIYNDGRAERTEIQTGVNDGEWIEVTNIKRPTPSKLERPWVRVTGKESVILGDLAMLADGAPVAVADERPISRSTDQGPNLRPSPTQGDSKRVAQLPNTKRGH
jgi:multidrug efflux pump subunit AcrA (membrane-fusion protein)